MNHSFIGAAGPNHVVWDLAVLSSLVLCSFLTVCKRERRRVTCHEERGIKIYPALQAPTTASATNIALTRGVASPNSLDFYNLDHGHS